MEGRQINDYKEAARGVGGEGVDRVVNSGIMAGLFQDWTLSRSKWKHCGNVEEKELY